MSAAATAGCAASTRRTGTRRRATSRRRSTQGDHDEGHGPGDLAGLLAAHASDPGRDRAAFFDALAFNWLVANTDAHSKNYSFLIGPGDVRLAPLYDVWSIMPNSPGDYRTPHPAMSALADRRILAADSPQAWQVTAVPSASTRPRASTGSSAS